MECNKEEALRAKEIAEKRMRDGDFSGAQKMVFRAQRLFPELDNVSQMLTVCEVHCSAQFKIMGTELDWYKILQIEQSSDETTIKKQYRKLALLLHPDKNKFSGAEAAFKLIGEANRVLTDQTKRSVFDMKCKSTMRTSAPNLQPQQPQMNTFIKKQYGAASNVPNGANLRYGAANNVPKVPCPQPTGLHTSTTGQPVTFWTCCTSCGIKYQYFSSYKNKTLRCQNQRCLKSFIAYDLSSQGAPPWNQNGIPNPGVFKGASQSDGAKPSGMKVPDKFARSHPVSNAGNTAEVGGGSKTQEKVDSHMKQGVRMPKPGVANGKNGGGIPKPDLGKPSESGASKNASKKRRRKSGDDGSDSEEIDVDLQENGGNHARQNQVRKSSRQKQNVSYNENSTDVNDFVSPARGRKPFNSSEEGVTKAAEVAGASKDDKSAASVDGKCKTKGKDADVSVHDDSDSEVDNDDDSDSNCAPDPEIIQYPDPEFNDFDKDKTEQCFAANQVWAIYDTCDGMPRFYARIKKVLSPGFKLQITWLEPDPDDESENKWFDVDLPVACGKYTNGGSEQTEDPLMFSHQITCIKGVGRGSFLVYPKMGETWALFTDWDIMWSSDPEKHKPPYRYEFVEILSNFDANRGIGVAFLGKVKGFVSLFQRMACGGVISCYVSPRQLYRFSHRIPSFKMTGKEKEGVPAGCFELDPASLPTSIYEPDDTKAKSSCPKSPEPKAKSTMDSNKISTPKKHESNPEKDNSILRKSPRDSKSEKKVDSQIKAKDSGGSKESTHSNSTQPKGSTKPPADENIHTPNKNKNNDIAMDALKPRRSPRDVKKKNS